MSEAAAVDVKGWLAVQEQLPTGYLSSQLEKVAAAQAAVQSQQLRSRLIIFASAQVRRLSSLADPPWVGLFCMALTSLAAVSGQEGRV